MTMNLSPQTQESTPRAERVPRILVLGGGIAAQVVTDTLSALGADVTFARITDTREQLYAAQPGTANENLASAMCENTPSVAATDLDNPPAILREKQGFVAEFPDGTKTVHDSVIVAPGAGLRPKPATLPEEAALFSSDMNLPVGQNTVFLLDYQQVSDPALGMAAVKAATENVRSGGRSVVCFKHVPVRHLFGETLYDEAKREGVQFIRYGTELPNVQVSDESAESPRFHLTVPDAIDREEDFAYGCDHVVVVTGPDPSSVPAWAKEFASKDLDAAGFILPDSVHCASGNAFASGVFLVGEGTGSADLIGCVAQARSAAVKALAWIKTSAVKGESESISIGSACVRCLTCHRVCPHEAIPPLVDPLRARMSPVPALCRDCGICASACPSVAIRVPACSEETLTRFVADVPREEAEQTLFVFGCQRSAGIIAQTMDMPEHVRFLPVTCAGSVSENVIWSGLAAGARGILVVGCHHGNCASHTGTDWAAARVRRTLDAGIFSTEAPRVGYATIASNEPARFSRLVATFLAGLPVL